MVSVSNRGEDDARAFRAQGRVRRRSGIAEFPKDSDGSAKVALIGIDRSIAAWRLMQLSLPERAESIVPLILQLERLRSRLEKSFPEARDFVRPGFDEILGAADIQDLAGICEAGEDTSDGVTTTVCFVELCLVNFRRRWFMKTRTHSRFSITGRCFRSYVAGAARTLRNTRRFSPSAC